MKSITFPFLLVLFFFQFEAHSQKAYAVEDIPDDIQKGANSVVRHDDTRIDFYGEKLIYTFDYAVTIFNQKHADFLVFGASYQENSSELKDIKITIHDADGNPIKEVKKKEITDFMSHSIEFVTDRKGKGYRYTPISYPVTIHYSYKLIDKSPYQVMSWYPSRSMRQAVQKSSITINDYVGDSFEYQENSVKEYRQDVNSGDAYSQTYSASNLKPQYSEKYMPAFRNCLPSLQIALKRLKFFEHEGFVTNWSEFSAWAYDEMFVPKIDISIDQLKSDTESIVEASDSDLIKAQKLYEFIQNNTRYVLISLEDGGWSPLSISTVHEKKYGDCKALSFYYNTLCKAHDIDAKLVLINAGDEKFSADRDFYSTTQFNHVITRLDIEDKNYWVDCTSNVNPFDFLGSFTDDRNALVLGNGEETIITTPSYPKIKSTSSVFNLKENTLTGDVLFETTGIGVTRKLMSNPNFSDQERSAYFNDGLFRKYKSIDILENSFEYNPQTNTVKESFKISAPNEVEVLGDYLKIPINKGELKIPSLKKDKKRTWPIEFLRDETFESSTIIEHELTLVPQLEEDVHYTSSYGEYKMTTEASAGKVIVHRSFTLKKGTFDPSEYKDMRSFFLKIKKAEKGAIIFANKS